MSYFKTGDYYNSNVLFNYLVNYFGNMNISEFDKKLMIISTNSTSNIFEPYVFRSYKLNVKEPKFNGSNNESVENCIRASTAAPTYFSPFIDLNGNSYVDGGLVANNPTKMAILESKELWENSKIDLILSIGTGTLSPDKGSSTIKGLSGELLTLVTNSDLIHQEVIELLYNFSKDTEYFRFSPIGLGSVKLDTSDVTILKNGEIETVKYMQTQETQIEKLVKILDG